MNWEPAEIAAYRSRAGRLLIGNPRAKDITSYSLVILADTGCPRTGHPVASLGVWLSRATNSTLRRFLALAAWELAEVEAGRRARRGDVVEMRGPSWPQWNGIRAA